MSVLEPQDIAKAKSFDSISFDCFVLAPKGLQSPRVLRAAERAGGLGFVQSGAGAVAAEIAAATKAGVSRVGVIVGTLEDIKTVAGLKTPAVSTVMAPADVLLSAKTHAAKLRKQGVKLLCVAIHCDDRSLGLGAEVDG